MLRIALIAAILTLTIPASAQDKIYLLGGDTVEAKVKEVGPRNIIYVRWDNQQGAEYIVGRRDVSRIVFQNGTEEIINPRARRPVSRENSARRGSGADAAGSDRQQTPVPGYGRNIIALAPIQMSNQSAAGIGVHYEGMLGPSGYFAIYLPLAVSFFDDANAPSGTRVARVFGHFYPGVKIYPAGSSHRLSYSVAPTLAFTTGNQYELAYRIDPGTGSTIRSYDETSVFRAGFMVHNGLNLQPTKQLYVGIEVGLGIVYYTNESSRTNIDDVPLVQFNFKMGYRF